MKTIYGEDVSVTRTEPMDILESSGLVEIIVNSHDLTCFCSEFKQFNSMVKSSETQVSIDLMTKRCLRTRDGNPDKEIKLIPESRPPFRYIINGILLDIIKKKVPVNEGGVVKIIEIADGIVDCGIRVGVELNCDEFFNIGDHITAEGRLDIRII